MSTRGVANSMDAAREMLATFATSGTSVAVATAITHPIDVVKVHQQMQAVGQRGPTSTMVTTAGRLISEGGPSALYRGVNPAVVRALSYGAVRLGLYEPCKNFIMPEEKSRQHMGHKIAAGILSGSIATAASNPLDVAKVRMQMRPEGGSAGSAAAAGRAGSMVGQIAEISRKEGVAALWKGVGPSMGRASALTAAQCAVYDECKQMLRNHGGLADGLPLHLSASMMAGAVSTLASSPFDTVKTRMMASKSQTKAVPAAAAAAGAVLPASHTSRPLHFSLSSASYSSSSSPSPSFLSSAAQRIAQRPQLAASPSFSTTAASLPLDTPHSFTRAAAVAPPSPAGAAVPLPATAGSQQAVIYRSSLHCAYSILKTEGLRGLYKGCAANYARLAPMTAITFIVYEKLRQWAGLSSL